MANSIEEILGKQINSVKELKAAIKELQDSLVGVDAESEEFKTTSEQLAAAQAELNKVTKAGKADNDAATDSIRGMEQEYKKLYDTYKMLTEEQRNSDFGKNMAESLEQMSTKINDAKKEVGNFTSNIGRYAQGATEAFNQMGISVGGLQAPMKMAAGGTKTLGTALKTLAANPIVLVITALVAILAKAAEAIKKNEELTNRLQQAMAVFKPILDAVSKAFDFLAGILVKTIEGLSKVAEKIMSIIPGMKQAIQSHKELEKATQNLTKATREANIENSKKAAEIERLREEASETENLIEKKKLLEEAKKIQAEVDQKNIELAQEELRILQEYSEKTANAAEDNEKLAAAQKKVNDAIAQGERNMRQYNKQLAQTEKSTKTTTTSSKNYREEATKLYKELVNSNKTEIQLIEEKYREEKKLLEKYNIDTTLLTKKYEQDVSKIRATEIKNQLNYYQEQMALASRVKKLEAENYESQNGHAAALVKQIKDYERIATTEFDRIYEVYYNAYNSVGEGLKTALEELWQGGIMTQATDFEHIIGSLQMEIKEFGDSVEGTKYKEALEAVKKLGEEGWAKLTYEMQRSTSELQTNYGITVDNVKELIAQEDKLNIVVKALKKELKETYGEESAKRISDFIKTANLDMLKNAFSFDLNLNSWSDVTNFIKQQEYVILEEQKSRYEQELATFSGTTEQKLQMMQEYYEVLSELRERDAAAEELNMSRHMQVWDAAFERNNSLKNALNNIVDLIDNYIQAEINSGKITKKEAEKKQKALENLRKVQLAVTISTIACNTAGAIIDVWRGYSAELPVNAATAAAAGPAAAAVKAGLDAQSLASAILRSTAIGAEGTAQVAAAIGGYISKSSSNSLSSEGGTTGLGATPTLIDSSPYSYTRTVQTTEEEDELNRPIYVTVTDIEDGLKQKVTVTNESSF